jgi:rubrerythrin
MLSGRDVVPMSTILSRRTLGRVDARSVQSSRAVRPTTRTRSPPRIAHRRLATAALAESVLVWSCLDCGTVGPLDPLPVRCPACTGEVVTVVED